MPDVVVTIGKAIVPTLWARMNMIEGLRSQLASSLPNLRISINLGWNGDSDKIEVFAPTFTDGEGVLHQSEASADAITFVRSTVLEVVVSAATHVLSDFRRRIDRCRDGLDEFRARPTVLREFMSDVANLYGFVVETDLAFLMASDHFNRSEQSEPGSIHQFSRGDGLRLGEWGILTYHERSAADLGTRFSFAGINRVLRNRAVVIYLFDLWEYHYRDAIRDAVGLAEPPSSDIFGDLRRYRNKVAHGSATLDKPTKVLNFVRVGESIDLVGDMDALFAFVVEELNAIAARHFGVATHFSLTFMSNVLPIAEGPGWSDAPRSQARQRSDAEGRESNRSD
ncbi:MAG: hypothetical protein JNL14_02850 [Devosia sp.]|uniref:hypothetical protein n=1 Tax=Devosia sp. TaxID=1871048 RepID=UPI001A60E1C0|nr:hypothetical protein [Devosia sp.]MBL8596658.1 hypothetical protein [Devosia sp.]